MNLWKPSIKCSNVHLKQVEGLTKSPIAIKLKIKVLRTIRGFVMAEYKELIKNFEHIRTYLRDFFVYGFHSRADYTAAVEKSAAMGTRFIASAKFTPFHTKKKSARTYDNERRRIESYLTGYVASTYQSHEKQTAILINSSNMEENPLYCAWKAKTFTANDIMLHFFLLDYFTEQEQASAPKLCDKLPEHYGILFELQTIRNKLKEYVSLGLLKEQKQGRELIYSLPVQSPVLSEQPLLDALKFYQEASPFGFVGSTILEKYRERNHIFRFKHAFIVHTLEDQILFDIISAISHKQYISVTLRNRRVSGESFCSGVPLQIFVSTQTGRRYLCLYSEKKCRFGCHRLDYITQIKPLGTAQNFDTRKEALLRNQKHCWGVSFGGRTRLETVRMILSIRLPEETYLLNRLKREGRGGTITQLSKERVEYTGQFFDANEMLTWIKTFTGRILSLSCSNRMVSEKFYQDMKRMQQMYSEPSTPLKPCSVVSNTGQSVNETR